MESFLQDSFFGGINMQDDATRIANNEYFLLFNGRTRKNTIRPVKYPLDISNSSGLPSIRKLQGLYGVGTYLLVFIDGEAYYRDFNSSSVEFNKIAGFQMSSIPERLYLQLVPASSLNFSRILSTTDNDPSSIVHLGSGLSPSPTCAIVQDEINQPRVIFPNGNTQITQTYDQWSQDNREYVPIGGQMLYDPGLGILYVVAKDLAGRYTQIYRSVSGRPLDFMVNITKDGDKLPTELEGGAQSVSHRVDFDEISAINRLDAGGGGFFVGTKRNSYIVSPNFERSLLFGEPTFNNSPLFSTGPQNIDSVVDILGDTALIDLTGIRSFNAVLQQKNEGRNTPFSAKISPLFEGIKQTTTASINFDNYALFSVQTVYGPAIIVYDTTRKVFVSIDIYPEVGLIKQFAEIKVGNTHKLFFITTSNKIFEYEGSTVTAICRLYPKEVTSNNPKIELQGKNLRLVFTELRELGEVQMTPFPDRVKSPSQTRNLTTSNQLIATPQPIPYYTYSQDNVANVTFSFDDILAWKIGFLIEWNCDCELLTLEVACNLSNKQVGIQQSAIIDGDSELTPDLIAFVGDDGEVYTTTIALNNLIRNYDPQYVVGLGNHNYPSGAIATQQTTLRALWSSYVEFNKFYAALGNIDLDTLNGQAHLQYLLQPNNGRYFNVSLGQFTELFVINSGIRSDGSIVEGDGIDSSSNQALWIRDRLQASTKKWKIVVLNAPPYSNFAGLSPGRLELRWPFKLWGASVVISAKAKVYERLYLPTEDLTYLVCGLGGAVPIGNFITTPGQESVFRYKTTYGFLLYEANMFNAEFKFLDINNQLIDRLVING